MVQPAYVVSKPSSSKDIGASRMKLTASVAEDPNTSTSPSESEFEDAGDDPATFAVVDWLKVCSELQLAEPMDVLI